VSRFETSRDSMRVLSVERSEAAVESEAFALASSLSKDSLAISRFRALAKTGCAPFSDTTDLEPAASGANFQSLFDFCSLMLLVYES